MIEKIRRLKEMMLLFTQDIRIEEKDKKVEVETKEAIAPIPETCGKKVDILA